MKIQITIPTQIREVLGNMSVNIRRLVQALEACLGEQLAGSDIERIQKSAVKVGKLTATIGIKATDKKSWNGVLTSPLAFFHLCLTLEELNKAGLCPDIRKFDKNTEAWLMKFVEVETKVEKTEVAI